MNHPRTTILGILSIASTVINAIVEFMTHGIGSVNWGIITSGVALGWGLIHAADAAVVAPVATPVPAPEVKP